MEQQKEINNLMYDQTETRNKVLKFSVLEKWSISEKGISGINDDVLISLGLMNKKGNYTIGAELLADDNDINNAVLDMVIFGQDISTIIDRKIIAKKSLLTQYEEATTFFNMYYPKVEIVEGFVRKSKYRVPLEAYQEALANALIHRDYLHNGFVSVKMYHNRIEITSPGGLPKGLTEEEYLNNSISMPRNTSIAYVFYFLGIIERLGSGIYRINNAYEKELLKPQHIITDNYVTVILPNILFDDTNLIPEQRIINFLETQQEITRSQVEILLGVNKTNAIRLLNNLVDNKTLKTKGEGRNLVYVLNNRTY